MQTSLPTDILARFLAAQLNHFFPDDQPISPDYLKSALEPALQRTLRGLSDFSCRHFWNQGELRFYHLNSDQETLLLYNLSRAACQDSGAPPSLADKCYLLNKALHSVDIYHGVELPEAVWFAHAVGSVLGRAQYNGPLGISQQCTIGNKDNRYPKIGRCVMLCTGASILGDCNIGDNVCIGAGAMLIDQEVPSNSTVVGRYPSTRILPKRSPLISQVFRHSDTDA